jgi:hypothetical protein
MHTRFTPENIFLAIQQYRNWPEVIRIISKTQNYYKVVLERCTKELSYAILQA